MKIALVTPLPDPQRWSMKLYEQSLYEHIKPLLQEKESIALVPSPEAREKWQANLQSTLGKYKRYIQQYILYGMMLQNSDADIFHITDHAYANLIPFLRKKKTIVTFHDAVLLNLAEGRIPVLHRPRLSIAAQRYCLNNLSHAHRVISVSEFSKQECLRYSRCQSEQIQVIHEGISSDFSQAVDLKKISDYKNQWNLKGKIILVAGRTDPHKNMEGTLETLKKLSSRHHLDFTLLKIGSDLSETQKQKLRESGLLDSYRYLGSVPNADLPLIYQTSDALLFLSFYEGFGFPVLEAMASRVPVMISNCASLPEIAGGNALIVNPSDGEQAADKLFTLLTDVKLRNILIDKGKEHIKRFSWQETARRTLEVYRKVHLEGL